MRGIPRLVQCAYWIRRPQRRGDSIFLRTTCSWTEKCHLRNIPSPWTLKQLHFRASDDWKLCVGIEAVIAYCDDWDAKREKLAYEIDGVVVTVNSIPIQ